MSDLTIKVCDVCDRQKGQTNHWYTAYVSPLHKSYFVEPMNSEHGETKFDGTIYQKVDLCSVDCLNKAENRTRDGVMVKA